MVHKSQWKNVSFQTYLAEWSSQTHDSRKHSVMASVRLGLGKYEEVYDFSWTIFQIVPKSSSMLCYNVAKGNGG